MRPPLSAVAAGHICLDLIPALDDHAPTELSALLRPGRLVEIGSVAIATGGSVSNTGLALRVLGVETRLVCKVGDDPFGRIVRRLVAERDPALATAIAVDPAVSTSYSIVISPPGVDRVILHHAGANDSFGVPDVDLALLERVGLFHFGYPPLMRRMYEDDGRELAALFERAKGAGATTSLDTSYPDPDSPAGKADWRAILERALPHVDVFLPSIDELLTMLDLPRYAELSGHGSVVDGVTPTLLHELGGQLLELGARIVAIKLGHRGLYLRTTTRARLETLGRALPSDLGRWSERELWAPCFATTVAGTTGSGDATIAGFHAALLRDLGPEETVTTAVAVGSCCVEAQDALSGIRTWDATRARIREGRRRLPLELDDPTWRWLETEQLWERQHG